MSRAFRIVWSWKNWFFFSLVKPMDSNGAEIQLFSFERRRKCAFSVFFRDSTHTKTPPRPAYLWDRNWILCSELVLIVIENQLLTGSTMTLEIFGHFFWLSGVINGSCSSHLFTCAIFSVSIELAHGHHVCSSRFIYDCLGI